MPGLILRQMRVRQWTKNLFVFAPVVFAKQAGEWLPALQSVAAFLAIGLAASATYIGNDIQDIESDRAHPKKRHRPIASGAIGLALGERLALFLFVLAFGVAAALGWAAVVVLGLYVLITLAYSLGLKRVPLLELFIVAAGFVLRVILGWAATGIPASPWLLLTMLFLALLLAFGKRRGEIGRMGDEAASGREVLEAYSLAFLDRAITLLATATLLCYAIYCTAEVTVQKMGTQWLIATTPFVAYGVIRYLWILEHGEHASDSPSELLLSDRSLQVAIVLWLATAIAIVYTHSGQAPVVLR